MKKKIVSLVLFFALALALGIGGTVAWLTTKTDSIVNTFTVGDINITLTESENLNFKMVPGSEIVKDPKVSVVAGSEDCYLFVKIEESTEPKLDDYIEYDVATGWTELPGVDGVYYREAKAGDSFGVIGYTKDEAFVADKVLVKDTVTKAMMNGLGTKNDDGTFTYDNDKLPKLTFTAYAVQKDNIANATTAWNKLANPGT